MTREELIHKICPSHLTSEDECIDCAYCMEVLNDYFDKYEKQIIEKCARTIENSKTLFENHQTETIMRTKDKCITMIRNLKEQSNDNL